MPSGDPGARKRRSTRIVQAVPITITGVDALGQPFKERTTTVSVNCHGCKYQSKHYVPKNSMVTLEVPRLDPGSAPRALPARVIWVQRPRTVRELFQIGVEFEFCGNVWGIAFPPEDWFPCPGEEAPGASASHHPEAAAEAQPSSTVPKAATPGAPSGEAKMFVVPGPAQEGEPGSERQLAKMVADAKESLDKTLRRGAQSAINEEMTIVRQQLDVQLHETVERAIKISMERVSESAVKKVVQNAAERTAAIVEEARKASEQNVQQLDAKVREAVEEAVTHAAEQAAQSAAQQTAAQNLKQAVEEAIERAMAERDASAPSLEVLASPEAAQQQLDYWKKSLEETAESVRSATIGQTHAELETALAGASDQLGEKVEEAIFTAETTIQSLESRVAQEKARAEGVQTHLEEMTASALSEARRRMDEMLSTQFEEIGRKADEIISERAQHIEPMLRDSTQEVIQHFTHELDQTLAPRMDEVKKVVSQLATTGEQAAQLRNSLREEIELASEQAIEQSLERLRQETAKFPAEFEEARRKMISNVEEELIQKSTEAQHTTYEALLRASEWYQKKAHTTMQASLEKAVEQSTGALRDRAAEISSLAASELDHHRRAFAEHAQGQMEEAAKEVVGREREKLNETAEIAGASFADRTHQASEESFRQFEQASRQTLEKVRSDLEYSREGSLVDFQKRLEEKVLQSVEKAQTQLQSQVAEMMQGWVVKQETQHQEWLEQMKKSANESMDQYKERLENASNSFLLASAATLGQHSQAILDTLANAAEKRLRETCSDVLARMGESMRQSLQGPSTDFNENQTPPAEGEKK